MCEMHVWDNGRCQWTFFFNVQWFKKNSSTYFCHRYWWVWDGWEQLCSRLPQHARLICLCVQRRLWAGIWWKTVLQCVRCPDIIFAQIEASYLFGTWYVSPLIDTHNLTVNLSKELRWRSWTAARTTTAAVRTTASIQPMGLFAPVTLVTDWTTTLKPVSVRGCNPIWMTDYKKKIGTDYKAFKGFNELFRDLCICRWWCGVYSCLWLEFENTHTALSCWSTLTNPRTSEMIVQLNWHCQEKRGAEPEFRKRFGGTEFLSYCKRLTLDFQGIQTSVKKMFFYISYFHRKGNRFVLQVVELISSLPHNWKGILHFKKKSCILSLLSVKYYRNPFSSDVWLKSEFVKIKYIYRMRKLWVMHPTLWIL